MPGLARNVQGDYHCLIHNMDTDDNIVSHT